MGTARAYREVAREAATALAAVGDMLAEGGLDVQLRAESFFERIGDLDRAEDPNRKAAGRPQAAAKPAPADPDCADDWKEQGRRSYAARQRAAAKSEKPGAGVEPPAIFTFEKLAAQTVAPLDGHEPELRGQSARSAGKARRLRLVGLDADGNDSGYVDEGSAAELAGRNGIGPSTIYALAKSGKPSGNGKWRVERVMA